MNLNTGESTKINRKCYKDYAIPVSDFKVVKITRHEPRGLNNLTKLKENVYVVILNAFYYPKLYFPCTADVTC